MAKDSNSEGYNSPEELPRLWSLLSYFPKTSRGSPLLSRDIKILTTIANHKQRIINNQMNRSNCSLVKSRNIGNTTEELPEE